MSAERPGSHRRVVAFRHVPFEGVGLIASALEQRGLALEYADLYIPQAEIPCVANAAGVILMGGPMSVNDPLPYLQRETEILLAAIERGQPVLGICLGSQLIAKAMGSRVYRNPVKEIGWFDIHLTEAGREDPVFSAMNARETVFHWHGETLDLPAGATRLASSEACANQAYRIGRNVYGMQFHLEVTPEMIADWCTQDENCGDVRELEGPIDAGRNAGQLATLAASVFGRWCDLLA
ncbi:MAG TPA: gamma-glutamyl-gamma-aminobutyrate hydrolase family protein [Bryobacteraceae bacterium]|nr:gamma-glutamyl-gamma-aminobutyrate hydrolase family protein [Bryobacteraceae bacterium]